MELRHLRYFCAVADEGSFSRASQRLHVAQSAISEQIADLERELGGALLNRTQRRIRLTPGGELFLTEARKTLQAAERAVDLTQQALRGQLGTLSVGFFLWGAGGFFARIIREYRRLHPAIRLSLYEMNNSTQMEALTTRKIDVGFTRPLTPPFDRTLSEELLYSDPVVAVLPKDHSLAPGPVSLRALAGEPFVMSERQAGSSMYDSILALCSSAGFSPEIVNTSATWSGVLTLVESGEGVALVPSGVRHLRTRGVVFCPLLPETTTIGLVVAWNPANDGPILSDFLSLVRENKERIQASTGS